MQDSKSAIRSVAFCAVAALCVAFLNFLLVPWSSLKMKFDAYESVNGKIETIVLGSSIDGDSIRPSVISEEFGANTFIFTPQSGYPEISYYNLLNATTSNNIKRAIVGWDILQNMQAPHYDYPHQEEFYRAFLPYIFRSREIFLYVFNGIMKQPYTYTFFEYSSFPDNLLELKDVFKSKQRRKNQKETMLFASSNFPQKPTSAENYEYFEPIDASDIEKSNFNFHKVVDLTYTSKIYESDRKYVEMIKNLCEKNNIDLYFIYCPAPDIVIKTLPNYYEMLKSARDMFAELNIKYIDTFDENYFPDSTNNKNFRDCPGHMTRSYPEIYTKAICKWIKETQSSDCYDK